MSKKNMESTRELMGTSEVTDYSIRTYKNEELVYFLIQPSNISVLSEESLSARIYGLMTVLKGITEIEMMCLNSRENFEDNKRYLKKRMEEETNSGDCKAAPSCRSHCRGKVWHSCSCECRTP